MFMTKQQIKDSILSLLGETGRDGVDRTIDYLLSSDFFSTGCHSHHRFEGGLAQHSLETCTWALLHCGDLPRESVILASLLHDTGTARHHRTRHFGGHGRKGVNVLERVCRLSLSPDESNAIRLHMHPDAEEMRTNSLAALVCKADKLSAGRHVSLRDFEKVAHAAA